MQASTLILLIAYGVTLGSLVVAVLWDFVQVRKLKQQINNEKHLNIDSNS